MKTVLEPFRAGLKHCGQRGVKKNTQTDNVAMEMPGHATAAVGAFAGAGVVGRPLGLPNREVQNVPIGSPLGSIGGMALPGLSTLRDSGIGFASRPLRSALVVERSEKFIK